MSTFGIVKPLWCCIPLDSTAYLYSSAQIKYTIITILTWASHYDHADLSSINTVRASTSSFFKHTRFELVTLNLQLHRNEIQHWFTSHLLHLNNDTLQHRALHESRISGLWPISVSLLPSSLRLCGLLKHISRSSTFILAIHLELMLICVMHGIFFINSNSQLNHICKLSILRCYLCINSCLILFCLACFFC